jgi:O-antigen/teichoic acid export membrane protein
MKSIGKGILVSSSLGVLAAVLSFINNILFIKHIGVTKESDRYLFLISLTISINYFFTTFFNANVIPEFLKLKKENHSNYENFLNSILKIILFFILSFYIIIGVIYWLNILLNLNYQILTQIELTVVLFALALPFSITNCLIFEILNINHSFKAAYLVNLIYPIFILLMYFIIPDLTTVELTLTLFLNNVFVFLINLFNLKKLNWSFSLGRFNFSNEFIKNLFVSQSNNILNFFCGNAPNLILIYLGTGSLTIVNTARSLVLFIDSAIINNVGNVMGVSLATTYSEEGYSKNFYFKIEVMINFMLSSIIPVFLFFLFYSNFFISFIYNDLPVGQLNMIAYFIKLFSLSLIFFSLNNVLTRIQRSLNKLIIFSTINFFNNIIYILILGAFVFFFKETGIPLALFFSMFVSIFMVNTIVFNKFCNKLPFNIFVYNYFKNNSTKLIVYVLLLISLNIYLSVLNSFFCFFILSIFFYYKKIVQTFKLI